MFARVGIYEVPADRTGEVRASYQEAIARIRESPGLADAYFLLSLEGGRAITITLWEDHEAMAASRVAASRLRIDASAAVGGDVVSVDEFEVITGPDGSAPDRIESPEST
jgi:heme-degrading monooxygenase HmoA